MSEKEISGKRRAILVLDDSETFQKTMKLYFEKKGIDVYTSSSVSEACRVLGRKEIDLVLLDFELKGINSGIELLNKLKKYSIFDPKIYACSGTEEDNKMLLEAGCHGIVGKDLIIIKELVLRELN